MRYNLVEGHLEIHIPSAYRLKKRHCLNVLGDICIASPGVISMPSHIVDKVIPNLFYYETILTYLFLWRHASQSSKSLSCFTTADCMSKKLKLENYQIQRAIKELRDLHLIIVHKSSISEFEINTAWIYK